MTKLDFCLCENKGADQLRRNCEADLHLCFHYSDSTNSLLLLKIRNFKLLTFSGDCTGQFVSDLVGNPDDRFSHSAAYIYIYQDIVQMKTYFKKLYSLFIILLLLHMYSNTNPFCFCIQTF